MSHGEEIADAIASLVEAMLEPASYSSSSYKRRLATLIDEALADAKGSK